MKKTNYKDQSRKDLLKALLAQRETSRSLRFGNAGSKSRNVKEISKVKKDIARIMTELNRQ